uniref:Uncharacterized protein n=1 Tax=Arcella intermedia TaxID=1963864 RepID=A0A6B2LCK9_9EUKA
MLVGGTRGIGLFAAVTLVRNGASVTIVGRSPKSAESALQALKKAAVGQSQRINYIQGDFSTVKESFNSVENIKKTGIKYDFMVVTVGVWPDWDAPLNVDGIEKSFAVNVVGRFVLFQTCTEFLSPKAQILNVLNSAHHPLIELDKELITGQKNFTQFTQILFTSSLVNDLVLLKLSEKWKEEGLQLRLMGNAPGWVKTDLHVNQGTLIQSLVPLLDYIAGVPEEKVGINHATILGYPWGLENPYLVDEFMIVRSPSPKLLEIANQHKDWVWAHLEQLLSKHKD